MKPTKDEQLIRLYEWAKRDQRRMVAMEATIAGILTIVSIILLILFVSRMIKG